MTTSTVAGDHILSSDQSDTFGHGRKGIAYDWQSIYAAAQAETIERELGAGGMATVYLAHDVRHDQPHEADHARDRHRTPAGPDDGRHRGGRVTIAGLRSLEPSPALRTGEGYESVR